MSAAKVVWGRFLGQIEAVLPRKLVPFWKAPAGEYFLLILCYFTWRLISATSTCLDFGASTTYFEMWSIWLPA